MVLTLLLWRFRIDGKIYLHKNSLNYSGFVSLGGKLIGIGVKYQNKSQYLFLGSVNKPVIKWKLLEKKKEGKKGLTKIVSRLENLRKKRTVSVRKLVLSVWKSMHWDRVGVSGEFGFDNPFLTGQVFGVFAGLSNLIPDTMQGIEITPDFSRRRLNIQYHSSFQVRPAILAWRVGSIFMTNHH